MALKLPLKTHSQPADRDLVGVAAIKIAVVYALLL